jgi:hypothetical protein
MTYSRVKKCKSVPKPNNEVSPEKSFEPMGTNADR